MKILIGDVEVVKLGELYQAEIDGEYTEEAYTFTGTLEEVYEQIAESKGETA